MLRGRQQPLLQVQQKTSTHYTADALRAIIACSPLHDAAQNKAMAAALAPAENEAIARCAFDISSVPGLRERLDPKTATKDAIATKKRRDGRGLDGWRACHVTTNDDTTSATIGASRACARARIGAPAQDGPRLMIEVRRGSLEPDDRWCRRLTTLLEDCWAHGTALDRGILDDGLARMVEVIVVCEADDGAIEDCVVMAASAAIALLKHTPLRLHASALTCAVTEGGDLLADPSVDEANGCARVTVVVGVDIARGTDVNEPAAAAQLLKVCVSGAMPAAALDRCVALAAARATTIQWP